MKFTNPRGGSSLQVVVSIITVIATGVIGLGILAAVDATTCSVNVFWGCDGGGGGGGGSSNIVQTPCTSSPNSCGMTNTGFISGGACNATPPADSACPTPSVAQNAYYSSRTTVGPNMTATIYWTAQNATACAITSDNPAFTAYTGGSTGSISSGVLTQTSTYTLSCKNGDTGPSVSKSLRIIYNPNFVEI